MGDAAYPHVEGVGHRHVEVDGLRLHVAEAGAGDPLVLLHGWPQHWYCWRKLIPQLAESYRVICPDLRGFGWSDAPPGRYETETLASDLLGLLDALALERVRFAGHDWGGLVGLLAALRAPERFERLAAMSIITPWYRPPLSPLMLLAVAYQFPLVAPGLGPLVAGRPSFIRLLLRGGTGPGQAFDADALDAYAERFRDPARARASSALYRSLQLREMPAIARGKYRDRRLTVPGLGLWGDNDPVITGRTFATARAHADSFRAECIKGAGHFLPEEAPEEVVAQLEPFLAG